MCYDPGSPQGVRRPGKRANEGSAAEESAAAAAPRNRLCRSLKFLAVPR